MSNENAKTDLTAGEVFDSLTGHDELEIAEQFGRTIAELTDRDPSMWGRALVFVIFRREGENDRDAFVKAMGLTMKQTTSFFAVENYGESEESGKGEPAAEQPPAPSLSSVI